eukprot:5718273-Pyramimonas_sp.AAC.1
MATPCGFRKVRDVNIGVLFGHALHSTHGGGMRIGFDSGGVPARDTPRLFYKRGRFAAVFENRALD